MARRQAWKGAGRAGRGIGIGAGAVTVAVVLAGIWALWGGRVRMSAVDDGGMPSERASGMRGAKFASFRAMRGRFPCGPCWRGFPALCGRASRKGRHCRSTSMT